MMEEVLTSLYILNNRNACYGLQKVFHGVAFSDCPAELTISIYSIKAQLNFGLHKQVA